MHFCHGDHRRQISLDDSWVYRAISSASWCGVLCVTVACHEQVRGFGRRISERRALIRRCRGYLNR